MPFAEKVRQYWLAVSGQRCQWEYYNGDKLMQCNSRKRLQVHHITPEGVTKARGGNPDESTAMVLCENHHVRHTSGDMFEYNSSMHPDVGHCYTNYQGWKQEKEHLEKISGRRIPRSSMPSPFDEMAKDHAEKARRGERYHSGDELVDDYYERKMVDLATRHNALEGTTRPKTHRRMPWKKAPTNWEWSRDLFDKK